MEAIVTKVLGAYLNKFIKGFNKEMLSLQIMKGQATMKDFELNGEILQELMMVPPNLEVVTAKCSQLDIVIPYMNLKHEPITFTLDRIDLALAEPEVIKPMPNTLQSMNKRNLTEKAEKMSVIKGVKLVVKTCHVTVQTLGRNTFHPDWKPSLVLEVTGLVIQSVNDQWEVVDLEKTFILDKEKNIEHTYKQAKIESISIHSVMTENEAPSPILENIPAELRFITQSDSRTGLWISSSLQVLFEELNFSWTQGGWQRMADLGLSIQACFAREVPEREGIDQAEARFEKMNKVSYGLSINRFVIELLKGQQGGEDGFTCFGFGLQTTLSPPRLTEYIVKDLGGREGDQKVECWESILEAAIASITLRERKPSPDKEQPYNRLLTQVLDTKNQEAFKPPNSALIAITVTHRTKVQCDEMLKRRVPQLEFNASMNGMQVVFDKKAWKDLFSFIIEGPVEAGIEQQGQKLLANAGDKKLEDFKSYYHLNAKFDFLAAETVLIIPPVVEAEAVTKAADLRNHALHMHLRKFTVTNQPDWPFPPFLKDALVHLPERSHSLTPAEGTIHKFQGEIHNVSFYGVELTDKGEQKEVILQPATLRFYGRYFPPDSDKEHIHRVEAMMHSSEMYGRVTTKMARYFHHLEEEHRKWGIITAHEEMERRKVNKMMQAAASGITEMKSSDLGDKKSLVALAKENADKAEEYAIMTSKWFIENLHSTAFIKLEKGSFEFPSPGAMDALFRHFELEEGAAHEKDKEIALARPDVSDWSSSMSTFKFERFEVVVDNNITSQTAVLNLRSVEVTGVDHPKMLASASVRCIPGRTGPTNCFEFRASRERGGPSGGPFTTYLNTRMQGLQVLSSGKPGGLQKGVLDILPEMKELISQAVTKYKDVSSETKGEVVGIIKESVVRAHEAAARIIDGGLEGLFASVIWKVEVGETEFQYLSPDDSKPIGHLLLASSNKNSLESQFKDIEEQLITTKLALAQSEAEKYDLQNQAHVAGEQVKKAKNEMQVLEGNLVNSKFALAEAQAENDNLKSELKKLQDELAARPAGAGGTTAQKPSGGGGFFSRKK